MNNKELQEIDKHELQLAILERLVERSEKTGFVEVTTHCANITFKRYKELLSTIEGLNETLNSANNAIEPLNDELDYERKENELLRKQIEGLKGEVERLTNLMAANCNEFHTENDTLQEEAEKLKHELNVQTKAAEIGAKNLIHAADEVERYRTALEDIQFQSEKASFGSYEGVYRFTKQIATIASKALEVSYDPT